MTDRARTIIDALAVGGITFRQYAELQAMYFELEADEQDQIDHWTGLGREIRAITPGSTDQEAFQRDVAKELKALRERGARLREKGAPSLACADDHHSLDLPEPRRFPWRACVVILAAAIAIWAVFRLGMAVQVELGRVGHE